MYLPEQRASRNWLSCRTCENGLGVLFARRASRGEVRLSSQVRGEDSLHQRELSPLCSQAEAVQEPARTGRVPKPCPEKGCGHLSQGRPCRRLSHERGNGLVLLYGHSVQDRWVEVLERTPFSLVQQDLPGCLLLVC